MMVFCLIYYSQREKRKKKKAERQTRKMRLTEAGRETELRQAQRDKETQER